MKKTLKFLSFTLLAFSFILPQVVRIVHANTTTVLTYNGTGIHNLRSVNEWTVTAAQNGTRFTVHHSQTRYNANTATSTQMRVHIIRNAFIGSTTEATSNFTGTTSGTFASDLRAGTYWLHFSTVNVSNIQRFNISGSVTRPR
ncbi:MAG: hypothetical protein FWG67_10405 [Defluviitaleaceae bacterium]|nr:hypothetical protein [Defluviitaleaceae bacterium]